MAERHGLTVEADVDEAPRVASRDLRALLFRLVRELLFNVVKHADIGHARVEAHTEEGRLIVQVSDDGKGFDLDQVETRGSGYGLSHMRERLRRLGGRLNLETPGARHARHGRPA